MDYDAAIAARERDFALMIVKLRDPSRQLLPFDREVLADFLEGKPRKRGPKAKVTQLDGDAAFAVDWLCKWENWPRDAAVERVAELMGETARSVRRHVARYERKHSRSGDLPYRFALRGGLPGYCPRLLRTEFQR